MKRLIIAIVILCAASSAEARRANLKFLLDFAPGVSIPIADPVYRDQAAVSFKHSIRVGAEIWFLRHFGIAGEVDFDVSPQMLSDGTVEGRFRLLAGLRLLFGFRVGAFFIRQAFGFDYIATRLRPPSGTSSFAVEPGVGLQFYFARYGVAGFAVDFPTAFSGGTFATDVQFLGFIGVRI